MGQQPIDYDLVCDITFFVRMCLFLLNWDSINFLYLLYSNLCEYELHYCEYEKLELHKVIYFYKLNNISMIIHLKSELVFTKVCIL